MWTSPVASSLPARSIWAAFALVLSLGPVGCSDSTNQVAPGADASPVDGAPADASPVDGPPADAAPVDASPVDGSPVDAAPVDAAPDGSAPLSLLAAGATQSSVRAAVPAFAAHSGLAINFTFGSAGALRNEILTGTSGADVAIVTPAVI